MHKPYKKIINSYYKNDTEKLMKATEKFLDLVQDIDTLLGNYLIKLQFIIFQLYNYVFKRKLR